MSRETCARKLTFFPLKEDGTYDLPIQLPHTVAFATKKNYVEKESKSDGEIEESTRILESIDITLEMSSTMPVEKLAKLTGLEYIKGMAIESSNTRTVHGCFAYEIATTGTNIRRRALRNAYVVLEDRSNETDSEGSTLKFVGKAITDDNGDVEFLLDQSEVVTGADAGIKKVWDEFFTTCPERPIQTP